jgi:hypothetical protein
MTQISADASSASPITADKPRLPQSPKDASTAA